MIKTQVILICLDTPSSQAWARAKTPFTRDYENWTSSTVLYASIITKSSKFFLWKVFTEQEQIYIREIWLKNYFTAAMALRKITKARNKNVLYNAQSSQLSIEQDFF